MDSSPCSVLRQPSSPFAAPVLAVLSMGTSWLASLWLSSPSVALALVVASAGVDMCVALDGVAVVTSRTLVTCSTLAGAIPGVDSSSVGGSGRLVVNILLQADAFRILVNGCLFCSESCGSTLQVALFLAIPALIARHKSIGSLSKASLLMVGWSTFNDESRGDASLSEIMLTPKSTAQQRTSILCHFRGGNRRGSTVCQAVCTSTEAQDIVALLVVTAAPQLPVDLLLFLLFGHI
uniref:DUF3778 domain-containing protein n=1 Tax=Oryza nivara TaxID=4536 RepID=A0A0E0J1N7_ORYNI